MPLKTIPSSGDITEMNGSYQINAHSIQNSDIAQAAAKTFKGNATSATADLTDMTAAQASIALDLYSKQINIQNCNYQI